MNKNTFTQVKLAKGEMNVYDFGAVKLHAYKTNDFTRYLYLKRTTRLLLSNRRAFLTIVQNLQPI